MDRLERLGRAQDRPRPRGHRRAREPHLPRGHGRGPAQAHPLTGARGRLRGHRRRPGQPGQARPRPRRSSGRAWARPLRADHGASHRAPLGRRRRPHDARHRAGRARGPGQERLGRAGRPLPSPGPAAVRLRRLHRAPVRGGLGCGGVVRPGGRPRSPVLPHQLPADGRRPDHVRRRRRAPALRRPGRTPPRPRGRARPRPCEPASIASSRCSGTCGCSSATAGPSR